VRHVAENGENDEARQYARAAVCQCEQHAVSEVEEL